MKNLISNIKEVLKSEAIPQFNALTELLFNCSCLVEDCFKATTITIDKHFNKQNQDINNFDFNTSCEFSKIKIYILNFTPFVFEKLNPEYKQVLKENPYIKNKILLYLNEIATDTYDCLKDTYKNNIDIKLIERDDSTIVRVIYKSM